jgi:hypothetical protein
MNKKIFQLLKSFYINSAAASGNSWKKKSTQEASLVEIFINLAPNWTLDWTVTWPFS